MYLELNGSDEESCFVVPNELKLSKLSNDGSTEFVDAPNAVGTEWILLPIDEVEVEIEEEDGGGSNNPFDLVPGAIVFLSLFV